VLGGKYVEGEAWDLINAQLRSAIPGDVSGDFKASVEQSMNHLNEYSLRKRLKSLLSAWWPLLQEYIDDRGAFVDAVAATRNYNIHYDESGRERAKTGVELYWLTEQLKMILEVLLLSELGLSNEEVQGILQSTRRYRFQRENQHLLRRANAGGNRGDGIEHQ